MTTISEAHQRLMDWADWALADAGNVNDAVSQFRQDLQSYRLLVIASDSFDREFAHATAMTRNTLKRDSHARVGPYWTLTELAETPDRVLRRVRGLGAIGLAEIRSWEEPHDAR